MRWAIWQSDAIATVSEAARRDIITEFRLKDVSIRVIPDAVGSVFHAVADTSETHRVLAKYGIERDQRIILYVGGISPHKNLGTLIDAFAALIREEAPAGVTLVLVGDVQKDVFYSNYSRLRARVEELDLTGRVMFTGFVSDAELVHFYNAAEFLVLPSFDEGFGLPAVEAMACGTPVIASRAGALPDVIGDAGRFFDPHKPEELKDRLRDLLEDEDLRERLACKAAPRAREFSWDHSARSALATFEDVVRGHTR